MCRVVRQPYTSKSRRQQSGVCGEIIKPQREELFQQLCECACICVCVLSFIVYTVISNL